MKQLISLTLLLFSLPLSVCADDAAVEIEYLLGAIGSSDCTFIRNGKRHSAADAEAHLRMKYRRGKRYATTTKEFIERLASRSSISKKPYNIGCGDEETVPMGEWLSDRLDNYRRTIEDR